jgi:CRISPR-associated protein Cas5t
MLGLYVTVPVACFRKGLAREYLETEALPPPATCYGFLLSFVGETDRNRHIGCRVTAALLSQPEKSVVLRTIWRIKSRQLPMGAGNNRIPAQQELLTGVQLVVWLDSSEEIGASPSLEQRVRDVLTRPEQVERFGGLSFGESTHLVDEVKPFAEDKRLSGTVFLLVDRGRVTLPVWVDHVGSEGTRFVTGDLSQVPMITPDVTVMPKIEPPERPTSPENSPRRSKRKS